MDKGLRKGRPGRRGRHMQSGHRLTSPSSHTLHHPMSYFFNVGFLSFEKEQKKSHISCTQLLKKTSEWFRTPATSTEMALNKLSGLLEQHLSS